MSLMALVRNDYEAEWNLGMTSNDINGHSEIRVLSLLFIHRSTAGSSVCIKGGIRSVLV